MALIKCPECGKNNVSDSVISCPECGYAIKDHFDEIRLEKQQLAEEKAIQEKLKAEAKHRKENESEHQQETIKRLENQIKNSSKDIRTSAIGFIISLSLTILFWCLSNHGSLGVLIVIGALATLFFIFLLFVFVQQKNTAISDLEIAKRNIKEYKNILDKRLKAIETQTQAQRQAQIARNAAKHPKCPMCGSVNTEHISTFNRATSIAMVGLASSKMGKQYQCNSCNHKW